MIVFGTPLITSGVFYLLEGVVWRRMIGIIIDTMS